MFTNLAHQRYAQGWGDVYFFCGRDLRYCTCNFRWNLLGWGKAFVLWNFVLSTALGAQRFAIQVGLDGLLPGEEFVNGVCGTKFEALFARAARSCMELDCTLWDAVTRNNCWALRRKPSPSLALAPPCANMQHAMVKRTHHNHDMHDMRRMQARRW